MSSNKGQMDWGRYEWGMGEEEKGGGAEWGDTGRWLKGHASMALEF